MLAAFEEAQAAAAPIYDMADIAADPHYAARGSIVEVDGVPMQGLVARLSATPGAVRWAGRALGRRRAGVDRAVLTRRSVSAITGRFAQDPGQIGHNLTGLTPLPLDR